MDAAVLIKTIEAALLYVAKSLLQRFLRRRESFFPWDATGSASGLRLRDSKRVEDIKAAAGSERKNARSNFVWAVATNFGAAFNAKGLAAAREEKTQVVVNFGGGSDRGTRVARGILLSNGDGWRDAGDFVDVGLFHPFEELAGISRKRLNVAALSFGIDGVKSEGGFARTADTRDDGNRIVWDFDGNVAQIVNAGASDADSLLFAEHGCEFFSSQGEAQTARFESTA